MNMYEKLLVEAEKSNVRTYEKSLSKKIRGLYSDNVIWINKNIKNTIEMACILAEELGHHQKTFGNILDQTKIENRQQELRARAWAYEKLVPLSKIVQAQKDGVRNRYELAEYLGVTENFLQEALDRFQQKYGLFTNVEGYILYFEPLGVLEMYA